MFAIGYTIGPGVLVVHPAWQAEKYTLSSAPQTGEKAYWVHTH